MLRNVKKSKAVLENFGFEEQSSDKYQTKMKRKNLIIEVLANGDLKIEGGRNHTLQRSLS